MPDSPHAVCSCLPTMSDVKGYEEGDLRVLDALKGGYPRFVIHPMVRELRDFYLARLNLCDRPGTLVVGHRWASELLEFDGVDGDMVEVEDGVFLVLYERDDIDSYERGRKYVQHTGCGLGSRRAEDILISKGLLNKPFSEPVHEGDGLGEVEARLAELYGCRREDVFICASGMSAFYSAFRAVRELQRARGRGRWIQLGWLYLDSGRVLREFLDDRESLSSVYDMESLAAVESELALCGDELAGVVVEVPTNPLVQWCDLERLASLVRKRGGVLMADPTMASAYNVRVLPHADVVVNSLTKYAAVEGDVMAGALALNRDSPHYEDLFRRVSDSCMPLYPRDGARLALEMRNAQDCVAVMNRNAADLASWFSTHPAISVVHYGGESGTCPPPGLSGPVGGCGAVITVELKGDMEGIYDRLGLMKGPSFGTCFTLVSPFLYLAHYDLVTSPSGRAFLKGIGLNPELLRISVGIEPISDIRGAFEEALSR